MCYDEIINLIKKEFLSIGIFKVFTKTNNDLDILSVKKSNYQLIKDRIFKNKSFIIILLISISIFIYSIL